MKVTQFLKQLWMQQKGHRRRFSCSHVETESLRTSCTSEANLIDLDGEAVPATKGQIADGRSSEETHSGLDATPMDMWALDVDLPQAPTKWTRGDLIGAGAYGKVYLGLNQETGHLMAVKQLPVPGEGDRVTEHVTALESEVEVLKTFHHPNIVRYLGTERRPDSLNIFLEYAAGGSVASLLSKFGPFEETLIRVFTRQILKGLEFLHRRRTAHRDIKGGNILVDHQGTAKLADFGASKRIETLASGFKSLKGTPYWMAPEVIKQTGHGRQADIWSVGCTVIEMATGKPPWSDVANHVTVMFHIAAAKGPPPIPDGFSHEGQDFLRLCFDLNPKERPNASRLLMHPFVAQTRSPNDLQSSQECLNLFTPCLADATASIESPTTCERSSCCPNLITEPSRGMTLKPLSRPSPEKPPLRDSSHQFERFTKQDLKENTCLKAQWAQELEKELKAMRDQ